MTKFPTLQTRNKRQSIDFRVFAHQQAIQYTTTMK
jgi:hypothetical protein